MGKGKTGGHWKPCNIGSVEAHNERRPEYLDSVKKAGLNLYFFEQLTKNNSHWVNDNVRYRGKTVSDVFEAMKKLYQEKTGQPPQLGEKIKKSKKTGKEYKCAGWSPIREMCVPIKEDTKVENFEYLKKWAKKYGIEIIRIDLHKDEGYHDQETGEYKMNYHAHVVASFLDWETGKTVKPNKEAMSEMQTILAMALGMERGELKKDTGAEYLDHHQYRAMMEELDLAKKKLKEINDEQKKGETKLKGLTTMLSNLEEQKEAIEIDITALEEERDNGNQEAEKKIAELTEKLNQLNAKIEERNEQISSAREQIHDLATRKHRLENEYDDLMRQYNKVVDKKVQIDSELEEADRELQRKRQEIEKVDKTGELSRAHKHIEDRDAIIYRRWPEARNAIEAIHQLGSTPSARDFTPQQALHIEHALVTSGIDRIDAAKDLLSLAQKDFENNRTWPGWVENTGREVMRIANGTHQRLTALLKQQPKDSGGSPSYITDLTDWAGNQVRL